MSLLRIWQFSPLLGGIARRRSGRDAALICDPAS
jgi:hypothetical protein